MLRDKKGEVRVWNSDQHPYRHTLEDFAYTHEALPGVSTISGALDWYSAVFYPNTQGDVPLTANLPITINPTISIASPGVVTAAGHNRSDNDWINFTTTGALPTGLVVGTKYFIINATANTFELSLTEAGASINTSGGQSGVHSIANNINDYRIVLDDGDGLAAGYRWQEYEGEGSPSWHKILDMDWSEDAILGALLNKTTDMYFYKNGLDDRDGSGTLIAGIYAGQRVWGGNSTLTNLTLCANSFDGTGYVQFDDHIRPVTTDVKDVGTSANSFRDGYFSNGMYIDTMSILGGSITDSSGAISFGNEDLSTTGTITGATGYFSSSLEVGPLAGNALILSAGSITDESGAISFGDENLSTTGTLGSNTITVTKS